jgi:hypothetical protein
MSWAGIRAASAGLGAEDRGRCRADRERGGAFVCAHCGTTVAPDAPGTRQRNHCPVCLHSLHVDITVGDRRSLCRGLMEPIALWVRDGGELCVLHRCSRCGVIRANRLAGDDREEAVRLLASVAADVYGSRRIQGARNQITAAAAASARRFSQTAATEPSEPASSPICSPPRGRNPKKVRL